MTHFDYLGLLEKELVIAGLAAQNPSLLPMQQLWPKVRFRMSPLKE